MKEFANRLRFIQRDRQMSQAQLAKTLGIAPGTLSGYLNDKNNPQITDVAKFAQKLGVTIGWLCGEDLPNIADILNNGESHYDDVLEITNKLLLSRYLGFQVRIDTEDAQDQDGFPTPYEEVIFSTANPVLLDYYKVYTTMQKLMRNSGITSVMASDLLYTKRMSLSGKKLNGEVEFAEVDDDELPF